MHTRQLVLDDFIKTGNISEADLLKIKEGARIIKDGGLCAFPTETVYGLGGNALMREASQKIYEAKGRPSDNPLIVHIADFKDIEPLIERMPQRAFTLIKSFWPGPMTLIFKKSELVPYETTGGLDTVAVRFPSHPVAMRLIKEAGVPVAAPSANISGRPSTTSGEHCREDLNGRVDAIIDGGSSDIGLESTIIDVTGEVPLLLRPGAVTKEMLEEVLNEPIAEDIALKGPLSDGERPKAPGMKYRHYAPKAPMVLVAAKNADGVKDISKKIFELLRERAEKNKAEKTALLCSNECLCEIKHTAASYHFSDTDLSGKCDNEVPCDSLLKHIDIKITGSRADAGTIAHGLFEYLREFDTDGADYIIAEGCSETRLGLAVMNRLKKAAAWHIIYV